MKQLFFHILMVCLFLPILLVIAISLNNFGFPLMGKPRICLPNFLSPFLTAFLLQ